MLNTACFITACSFNLTSCAVLVCRYHSSSRLLCLSYLLSYVVTLYYLFQLCINFVCRKGSSHCMSCARYHRVFSSPVCRLKRAHARSEDAAETAVHNRASCPLPGPVQARAGALWDFICRGRRNLKMCSSHHLPLPRTHV